MAWRYAFGFLFGYDMKDGKQKKLKGRLVKREGMTDGLKVSNNSAENMVSQGRFECFAYSSIQS